MYSYFNFTRSVERGDIVNSQKKGAGGTSFGELLLEGE